MRKLLIFIGCALFALSSDAQFNQDWGVHLGTSTHMGDIAGPKPTNRFQGSRASYVAGAFYRYRFNSRMYVKGAFSYASISGRDEFSEDPVKIARNLSFKTTLYELAGTVEYHFVDIKDFGGTGRYNTFFNVYVFGGVGATYFVPTAERDNGEWVKLAPLKTEGEEYSQIAFVIPMGIGTHMTFDRKWRIGLDFGFRPTFTDWLDDVHDTYMTEEEMAEAEPLSIEMGRRVDDAYVADAIETGIVNWPEGYVMGGPGNTRGGAKSNDWYFFTTASVSWLIRGKSNFYRARYHFTKGHRYKKRRSRAKF